MLTAAALIIMALYLLADRYTPLWLKARREIAPHRAGFMSWLGRGAGPRGPRTDP